jgi:hypothetical protein
MQKLKLKVNEAKSAVARPQERKFLGFSFTAGPKVKAHHCAQGHRSVQATNPGDHGTGERRRHEGDDGGTGTVYARLAQLFRLLRNAQGADRPNRLGAEATEGSYVAAVENSAPSPGSPTGTGGARAAGEKYRRQWSRPLVPREGSGSFFATHLRTPALEEWHAFRPTQRPIGTRRRNRGRKRREARWRWFYLLQIIRSVSRRESPATVKLVVKPFGI